MTLKGVFDDIQETTGSKYNGVDIGPKCYAEYNQDTTVDGVGTINQVSIPAWVDYYKLIMVRIDGQLGHSRCIDDQHINAPIGSYGSSAV